MRAPTRSIYYESEDSRTLLFRLSCLTALHDVCKQCGRSASPPPLSAIYSRLPAIWRLKGRGQARAALGHGGLFGRGRRRDDTLAQPQHFITSLFIIEPSQPRITFSSLLLSARPTLLFFVQYICPRLELTTTHFFKLPAPQSRQVP